VALGQIILWLHNGFIMTLRSEIHNFWWIDRQQEMRRGWNGRGNVGGKVLNRWRRDRERKERERDAKSAAIKTSTWHIIAIISWHRISVERSPLQYHLLRKWITFSTRLQLFADSVTSLSLKICSIVTPSDRSNQRRFSTQRRVVTGKKLFFNLFIIRHMSNCPYLLSTFSTQFLTSYYQSFPDTPNCETLSR
jgi:hypothetical protein